MLILNQSDVYRVLTMPDAIEAMRSAFTALRRGTVEQPNRSHLNVRRNSGVTLVMPAHASDLTTEGIAVKVVSVFPGNSEKGLARIQAALLVIDPTTGIPIALINGTAITAIRTAAASGLATDLLARPDSCVLAVVGTGVQASTHIDAIRSVREISEIRICGRDINRTLKFTENLRKKMDGVEIKICDSSDDAVNGADIVCTVTTATDPVFSNSACTPGTHINAVGSYQPHVREIPAETVVRSVVVVDQLRAALEEAGDLIQPLDAGLISRSHCSTELATVLEDPHKGRTSPNQITLFKSVGLAVEDVYAAAACLRNARRDAVGTQVDW